MPGYGNILDVNPIRAVKGAGDAADGGRGSSQFPQGGIETFVCEI